MPDNDTRSPADLADAHTEMPSLRGRKAIISGGTTGIGRAIARLLASEGAKVFVSGLRCSGARTGWYAVSSPTRAAMQLLSIHAIGAIATSRPTQSATSLRPTSTST